MQCSVLLPHYLFYYSYQKYGCNVASDVIFWCDVHIHMHLKFWLTLFLLILCKFMGKWYDIAIASTCPWLKRHKGDAAIGSLEMQFSDSTKTISMTRISNRYSTQLRHIQWTNCCEVNTLIPRHETPDDRHCSFISQTWHLQIHQWRISADQNTWKIPVPQCQWDEHHSCQSINPGVTSLLFHRACVFAHEGWNADVDSYVVHTNYDEYALMVMHKQKPGGEKTTSVKLYGKTSVFLLDNI